MTAIGPGYIVEKQEIEVEFVPSDVPHLVVRAEYNLRNTGNRPLSSLEVRLPGKRRFEQHDLRIDWDGSAIASSISPANARNTLLSLPQAWTISARHTLRISFEIQQPAADGPGIHFAADAFFLPAAGWSPELPQQRGLFGFGGTPPKRWTLVVKVPEGFLVHTSGETAKISRDKSGVVVRAEQRPQDIYPFVVAGRYQEAHLDAAHQRIYVWTRTAEDTPTLRRASESLDRVIQVYNQIFGNRSRERYPLWIVECPVLRGCFTTSESQYSGLIGEDPNSAHAEMLSLDSMLIDVSNDAPNMATVVGPSLAASWLGYGQNPGFYEQDPPLSALPLYAAALARESVDGPKVKQEIIRRALDRVPRNTDAQTTEDAIAIRAKSLLFFYELNDRFGREVFDHALSHMLYARSGRGFNIDDLISAFEQETHQNVAVLVRRWMKHPGVPEEFRSRYDNTAAEIRPVTDSKENTP